MDSLKGFNFLSINFKIDHFKQLMIENLVFQLFYFNLPKYLTEIGLHFIQFIFRFLLMFNKLNSLHLIRKFIVTYIYIYIFINLIYFYNILMEII